MRITTSTDFRKNMASELDRVTDDAEPLIVFRTGGKGAAVLVSLDYYQKLTGTDVVLPSPDASRDDTAK